MSVRYLGIILFAAAVLAGAAPAGAQGVPAKGALKDSELCAVIKELIAEDKPPRIVVRSAVELGRNPCTVVRCALEGGGKVEDVALGAVEGGARPDVVTRCAIDAGADPVTLAGVFLLPDLGLSLCYFPPDAPPSPSPQSSDGAPQDFAPLPGSPYPGGGAGGDLPEVETPPDISPSSFGGGR